MTDEQQPQTPPKKARFGSVESQFDVIGGSKTSDSQEVKTSSSQEVKKSKYQDTKTSDEEKKQQTVYLPKSLQKWLRVRAPFEERDISEVVIQALEEYRARVESEKEKS